MLAPGFSDSVKTGDRLGIVEWIERNVELPHSARNPRFRQETAPWLNRPLEEIAKDTNDEVVVCAPVGSGKTTLFECLLAWVVAQAPGPSLFVGQTDELGATGVDERFHVKHLHATALQCLGLDPNALSYFYAGLDQKLVGVEGAEPIARLLA